MDKLRFYKGNTVWLDLYKLVIYAYDPSRGVNKIVDLSCKFSLLSNFPAEIVNTVEKNI